MKLILISCCGKKREQSCKARDLYVSDLFIKSRSYAEQRGDSWAILSALHGVVQPDDIISPYNLTLTSIGKEGRIEWDNKVLKSLSAVAHRYDVIEVLAGRHYLGWSNVFRDCSVTFPLAGMGIGQRLKFLKQAQLG